MSLEDDYFGDDDAQGEAGAAPEDGAAADPEAAGAEAAPPPRPEPGGWLSGRRGWLLIIAVTLAQAIFASIVLALRSKSRPMASARSETLNDLAPDLLGREVRIDRIHQVMSVPGGRRFVVFMDMALILGELPEERVEGAVRPTPREMELFMSAISDLEPNIRSRVASLIRRIPPERYATDEAHREIAEDVRDYVNGLLSSLDFGSGLRPGLNKRRVTEVLLPAFIRQYS